MSRNISIRPLLVKSALIAASILLSCTSAFGIAQYSGQASASLVGQTDSANVSFTNFNNNHNLNVHTDPIVTNATAGASAFTSYSGSDLTASVGVGVNGSTNGEIADVWSSSESTLTFDILYAPVLTEPTALGTRDNLDPNGNSVLLTLILDASASGNAQVDNTTSESAGVTGNAITPFTSVGFGAWTTLFSPIVGAAAEILGYQTTIELFAYQVYSVTIGAAAKGHAGAEAIPEPGTMLLLGSGLLAGLIRKRI